MSEDSNVEVRQLAARLELLLREVAEMRAEVRAIAQALDQTNQTFRSIAVHLGVAAEPYRRSAPSKEQPPGFG